jgi:hypothetical protein
MEQSSPLLQKPKSYLQFGILVFLVLLAEIVLSWKKK